MLRGWRNSITGIGGCSARRERPGRRAANKSNEIAASQRHGMLPLGHVWTAPWQELSYVAAALVGCCHVSGLFVRRGWPLALMLSADQVSIETAHLEVR